jgi:tyrosine-protein phosphatase YwqE
MEMGVTKSIATPHVISDLYRNTPATINAALNSLKKELKNQSINFEVHAAAEYMLDSYFLELLNKEEKLLTIKDNIILTEFSYASMPNEPEQYSFEIQNLGYAPILAHPERYPYYHNNYKMYHRFIDLGFMLQINLLSLTGYYGKEPAKAAEYMLKNGMVSFVGTDLHHERHLNMLQDSRNQKLFKSLLDHQTWNDFLE